MKQINLKFIKNICSLTILSFFAIVSCHKKIEQNHSGPYKDLAPSPFSFLGTQSFPSGGKVGDVVKFKLSGIDSLAKLSSSEITFYINGQPSTIHKINIPDSTLSVIVPEYASSGAASLKIRDKIIFGPIFNVNGSVWIDNDFNTTRDQQGNVILGAGANRIIRDLFLQQHGAQKNLYLAGDFTTFNGEGNYVVNQGGVTKAAQVSYLLQIDPITGTIKNSFTKGYGPNAQLNGLVPLTLSEGYAIYSGGGFTTYDKRNGVNNITFIYSDGKLDSVVRNVYNPDPISRPEDNVDTLPRLVGGYDGSIIKAFVDKKHRLISIGGFNHFRKNMYDLSTANAVFFQSTFSRQVSAMDQDGRLDTTYNYDPTRGQVLKGANGYIYDAVQLNNGRIIIVGAFTNYNNIPAGRIAMLNDEGQVLSDGSFNASANETITNITYNAVTQKILVAGAFTIFNGIPAPYGLVMLNVDGSVDQTFKLGEFIRSASNAGQLVNYASQLNDGTIVISGNFDKYRNNTDSEFVTRQNFMMLNPDATLKKDYNNTGAFNGLITDIVETQTKTGKKALIISGSFTLFDNKQVGNIVKIGLGPQ